MYNIQKTKISNNCNHFEHRERKIRSLNIIMIIIVIHIWIPILLRKGKFLSVLSKNLRYKHIKPEDCIKILHN